MPASCAPRLFDDGQEGIGPMHTYFVTCLLYCLVHPQCILSRHFTYLQLLAYYPSL